MAKFDIRWAQLDVARQMESIDFIEKYINKTIIETITNHFKSTKHFSLLPANTSIFARTSLSKNLKT